MLGMSSEAVTNVETLYRIERFMGSITDLGRLLQVIVAESRDATNADGGSLLLYDAATNELYFDVALGEEGETDVQKYLKRIRLKMGSGIAGLVAETRQTVNVRDAQNDPRLFKQADTGTGFVTRSLLAVPAVHGTNLIGVLEVLNKREPGGFTEEDEKMLAFIASQAALVIENAQLYAESVRQARLSALGQGIAGAAHCIKNILNAIDGGSFILERALKKEDVTRATKGWDILSRNMGLMRELVLDMLTYAKPREPEVEATNLDELCDAICDFIGQAASRKEVAVAYEGSPALQQVVLDPNGVRRCLLNLMGNAVDASAGRPGAAVRLISRISERDGFFDLIIADNGCGMSTEVQKQLFQPFFSTKGSKGTGLGLAVTHKIIREHGGDILVESEEGKGTRFILQLPWKTEADEEKSAG